MMSPRYQEVPAAKIPVARTPDGRVTVRVIAGEALDAKAVIDTRTPIMYLHYTLEPGAHIVQPVPESYNLFAYVFGGQGLIGREGRPVAEAQMAVLARGGESVALAAPPQSAAPLEVLLIGGVPLGEPVARYGPFVMNTREEIIQAVDDYRAGRLTAR
jgi:quercetin 2,3-dioxygenase